MPRDRQKCPECGSAVCLTARTSQRFCADCGWEGSYTHETGAGLVAEERKELNGKIDQFAAKKWRENKS